MFWDDLIRRWRREARVRDAAALRALGGHVAVLPSRRPRRARRWPVLIVLAILIAVAILLLQTRTAHAGPAFGALRAVITVHAGPLGP